MSGKIRHIDTAVVSSPPGVTYGRMYAMHKYWSKKSPDVIAAYIDAYTDEGDIILDPFCGSGITACQAIFLDRKAVAIDLNPMATFITKVTVTPVNLSRLRWAFHDVEAECKESVSGLYSTKCTKCGKKAVVEFVVRDDNDPVRVAYKCDCSSERLFKDPDRTDRSLDRSFDKKRVPFWYPRDVLLPLIQKEKHKYLHELFTKRNLIALSRILNTIYKTQDPTVKDVLRLAFTAALDKCSKLKPQSPAANLSRPSLSQRWTAVRFYTPRLWQEVNPWLAFSDSFERVYEGKKETNLKLKSAVVGSSYEDLRSGDANVVILTGSAEVVLNEQLPARSVDYVITDPPFGPHIQYLALSTFWGAWLRFPFDYGREVVVNRHRQKSIEDYRQQLEEVFKSVRRVAIPKKYVHVFCHDTRGPYLQMLVKLMSSTKIFPEHVLHQPPPKSFGTRVRPRNGRYCSFIHYGSYIVRGRVLPRDLPMKLPVTEAALRKKVMEAVGMAQRIRGDDVPVDALLHSVYQKLRGRELLAFSEQRAESYVNEIVRELGTVGTSQASRQLKMQDKIREAVLDARALHGGQKNQTYQSVLRRFEDEALTFDDIHGIDKLISSAEEKEHRTRRYLTLLRLLGEKLGFRVAPADETKNDIIWEKRSGVAASFKVTGKDILVKAYRRARGSVLASEVGSISFMDLEGLIWEWCQDTTHTADELRNVANPVKRPGSRPPLPEHLLLKVLANEEVCSDYSLVTLKAPKSANFEPKPGQFVHVVCDPLGEKTLTDGKRRGYALTLRRPFSVHSVHYAGFDRRLLAAPSILPYRIREIVRRPASKIDILYKVVGEGTRSLSRVRPGMFLDIIGPLGNGFDIEGVKTAVVVAGGVGVAPLVALAERLRYLGARVYMYLGAVEQVHLQPIVADSVTQTGFIDGAQFCRVVSNQLQEIGAKAKVCIDDVRVEEKGHVTDILQRDADAQAIPLSDVTFYACGPWEMLKKVSNLARRHNVPCQVLLEERMACGIGACFSCTCSVREAGRKLAKKRVCMDGPVFNSESIVW